MTMKNRPPEMPAPRDHDDLSFSELVPFRSTKINLAKSPALYFLILLAICVPLLFPAFGTIFTSKSDAEFIRNLTWFSIVITFLICAMLQTMVFMYARTDRSFLHFWVAFVAVCAILLSPLLNLFFFVFRECWPFWKEGATGFVPAFLSMLGGAGLMEELLKAIPILIGAAIGIRVRANPKLGENKLLAFLQVRGPLDGAILGVFAGGGFTFLETGMQYVPNEMMRLFQGTKDAGASVAGAFLLLIPRALGAAVGHMAYSGIFGYFIGLAVLRPRSLVKLLAVGWFASATIHALWNSVAEINFYLMHVIAGAAAIGLASVLLKARQLESARTGVAAESFGSIVVERPAAPLPQMPQMPPVAHAPPAQPAYAPPPPAAAEMLALDIGGLQIPLRAGSVVDLSAEPALAGRGAGVIAAVVAHPTRANVLGMRNDGAAAWTARLRDGSQQQIEPHQNIRLAAGVSIAFGAGLFGSVTKLG